MGFFKKLFGKETTNTTDTIATSPAEPDPLAVTDPDEIALVSIIALCGAAGDNPNSNFIIRKIQKKNT